MRYEVHLFINGLQVGDDATFGEHADTDEALLADQKAYFESEGYTVESIEFAHPHWTERYRGTHWEAKIADGSFTSSHTHDHIATIKVSKA